MGTRNGGAKEHYIKGTADKGHLLQALGRKNREQTDENGCQADAIAG